MNRDLTQVAIDWLDAMSSEGLHETSSDLYEAINLVSEMRDRLKKGEQ